MVTFPRQMISRIYMNYTARTVSNFLFILLLFSATAAFTQTTYTAIGTGNWSNAGTWDANGIPPNPLGATDFIVINCTCTITNDTGVDIVIDGTMTIGAGSILDMGSQKLDIGKNADTATLTNNGTIQNSSEVKVKGTGSVGAGPFITNTGTINTVKFSVGNNNGGGQLTNTATGIINISGGGDILHVDGTLVNEGTITLTDTATPGCVLFHGAVVNGSGTIMAECIKLEDNAVAGGGASGGGSEIQDQSFSNTAGTCSGAGDAFPKYWVNGTSYTYQELLDTFGLTDGDQFVVDADNVSSCGEAPLPVELVYFKGKLLPKGVVLEWQTASELNNDFFEVEVATDGENYSTIANIRGQGTTTAVINYEFVDCYPATGLNYYRLRQVDFNGDFEYSNIISVLNDAPPKLYYSAYPQPASTHLTVQIRALDETNEMNLFIYNINGRIIKHISIDPKITQLPVDISAFANGLYLVRLNQAAQAYHGRLLIQK
jgi:hypothetical protein